MKIIVLNLIENHKYCEEVFQYFLKFKILKKTEPLFEKYIDKAISNLEFANFIMDEHKYSIGEKLPNKTFYDWCITIYYYSIYHTALALLTKLRYSSKNHLATIATLTLFYYHRENILEKEDIEFIIREINLQKEDIDLLISSKDLREKACYNPDEKFVLEQAKNLQERTAIFVNKVKTLLEN